MNQEQHSESVPLLDWLQTALTSQNHWLIVLGCVMMSAISMGGFISFGLVQVTPQQTFPVFAGLFVFFGGFVIMVRLLAASGSLEMKVDNLDQKLENLNGLLATIGQAIGEERELYGQAVLEVFQSNYRYRMQQLRTSVRFAQAIKKNKAEGSYTVEVTAHIRQEGIALWFELDGIDWLEPNFEFDIHEVGRVAQVRFAALGIARVTDVDGCQVMALVEPAPLQQGFWESVYGMCRHSQHYPFQVALSPKVSKSLLSSSNPALEAILQFIDENLIDYNREYSRLGVSEDGES